MVGQGPLFYLGDTVCHLPTHLETHAVGKLLRDLSDLQGKRQGDRRCSEAERDTEAGTLSRTQGAGPGVWNQEL